MALAEILPADGTAAVRAKMNAAIDALNDLMGEPSRAEAAEQTLSLLIAGEVAARQLLARAVSAASAARGFGTYRPGDVPNLFWSDLAGTPAAGHSTAGALGSAYLVPAGGTLALAQPTWLEPEGFYALRFVLARSTDPNPAAPAVVVGVHWLDGSATPLGTAVVRSYASLRVADGLQVIAARLPSAAPDLASVRPPAGAAFFRPYVQDLGQGGVLAVSSMTVEDASCAGVYAPDVIDLAARVRNLESRLAQFGG